MSDSSAQWEGLGLGNGFLISSTGVNAEEAEVSYERQRGNVWGQNAQRRIQVKGIFAKGHDVFAGTRHVAIRIVPEDQAYWRQQRPDIFRNQNAHKNWFATVGAGPTVFPCDGQLAAAPNRERDVQVPPSNLELLQYPPVSENVLIERLLRLENNYQDNLTYACVPTAAYEYNSNSWAAGLLNAADVPLPAFPVEEWVRYPAWTKPVPTANFNPVP